MNSTATWTVFAPAQTGTSANLNGLTQTSLYDWRVMTNCIVGNSAYTAAQFTTIAPVICDAPFGLSASSVSPSSATISWTSTSGAVTYTVEYKLINTSTWTVFASALTGTSATLNGLTPNTLYDWRVKTNCTGGSSNYHSSIINHNSCFCTQPRPMPPIMERYPITTGQTFPLPIKL